MTSSPKPVVCIPVPFILVALNAVVSAVEKEISGALRTVAILTEVAGVEVVWLLTAPVTMSPTRMRKSRTMPAMPLAVADCSVWTGWSYQIGSDYEHEEEAYCADYACDDYEFGTGHELGSSAVGEYSHDCSYSG